MVRTTRFGFDDGWTPDDARDDRRSLDDDWPDTGDPALEEHDSDDERTEERMRDTSPRRHLAGADWLRTPRPRRRSA